MPRRCCVPLCKFNSGKKTNATTFTFPKDPNEERQWLEAIGRENYILTPNSAVCIQHFESRFIQRANVATRDDGTVLVVPLLRPRLLKGACPSIFPEPPSDDIPSLKQAPLVHVNFNDGEDKIESFDTMESVIEKKIQNTSLSLKAYENCLAVYQLILDDDGVPFIVKSLSISDEFNVIIKLNNKYIPHDAYESILGDGLRCDRWTKFDLLLDFLRKDEK